MVLFNSNDYQIDGVEFIKISCGTSKVLDVDLSEANDFYPTYASLNSALFESSVILTVWKHADELLGDSDVMFLHTDIMPNHDMTAIFDNVKANIKDHNIGMTISCEHKKIFPSLNIANHPIFTIDSDSMMSCEFDSGINVWDLINRYDYEAFQYVMNNKPQMIYSHQFACNREEFDRLGTKLNAVVEKMKFSDVGLWTPHVFERLIGIYLSHNALLTSSFMHYASSSGVGSGDHKLYGPRPRKYYKIL